MNPGLADKGRGGSRILLIGLSALVFLACARPSTLGPQRSVMEEVIEGYLGTPYQFGGSSPGGMDCSGLVMKVYQGVGMELPRGATAQKRMGRKVGPGDLRFGDLLFFTGPPGEKPGSLHTGIFLGDGRFVHASKSRGVVVDLLDNAYWKALFLEGRRILQ